jgi:hypothetical protein
MPRRANKHRREPRSVRPHGDHAKTHPRPKTTGATPPLPAGKSFCLREDLALPSNFSNLNG